MENIKYKVINRGNLELKMNGKTMIIDGEITLDPPAFYVSFLTINQWNPPFDKEEISDAEKYRIIKALIEESRKEGNLTLYFD